MHKKKQIDWIDNLRVISVLAVITVHVTAPFAGDYNCNPQNPSWWQVGNIIDSTVRFCVPVFLMISGALWFSDPAPAMQFYKKKTLRLIGPFLFWSVMCYLFNLFYLHSSSSDVHLFEDFYKKFQTGDISVHFWYVYMLIGLLLIAPVFKTWINNVTAAEIKLYLIVWMIVLLYHVPAFDGIRINFDLKIIYNYTGYLVLGYYLSNHVNISVKKQKNTGILLFTVSVLFTIIGTYVLSSAKQIFIDTFYAYLSLNIVTASAGIFIWVKNIKFTNEILLSSIRSVAKHSYGIYLIHTMIIFLIRSFWDWNSSPPFLYVPVTVAICFFISWSIMALLNNIPYSKYIIS